MELNIVYVPFQANEWTVTRAIAKVLHSDDFGAVVPGRLINFRVKLNEGDAGGIRNDGSGTLTLPFEKTGFKFLDRVRSEPIKIDKMKLRFYPSGRKPSDSWIQTLLKTPYVDPDIEEAHQAKLITLEEDIRVDKVQFGILYRDKYPSNSRSFSIEWERKYIESYATLSFEYDYKRLLLQLGDSMKEKSGFNVGITFSSIQKIAVGMDGRPYILFELNTPTVLEAVQFHRSLTGDRRDSKKFKHRVDSLDDGHRLVAPYAHHLRLELYNEDGVLDKFVKLCYEAEISTSYIVRFPPLNPLTAERKGFFTGKRLHALNKVFRQLKWPIAFQFELLLHNGLLNTEQLDQLVEEIRNLSKKQRAGYISELLRAFSKELREPQEIRKPQESPLARFQMVRKEFNYSAPSQSFRCYHVTFTPTRMVLEGPYPTQSNRVIRKYKGYEDHFIRVDFRDEDRLRYRWDREVDGTSFVHFRVGGILKNGFELAGRQFEFLAYSTSALREHAVWFVHPFEDPQGGLVNGTNIRASLGNFTELLKMPSKYAARLAQAFTATDPSVDIHRDAWELVEDLVCSNKSYVFTDGVGTISRDLSRRIWKKLCVHRIKPPPEPSAYQIRFLGYKGVVAIDEELDKSGNGIHMRLRGSMKKFEVKDCEIAPIEIAQAFERPITAYLNRPLIMALEDLGVRKEAFIDLQNRAVANARTIHDSIEKFKEVLLSQKMGGVFGLTSTLDQLRKDYDMDLQSLENPFFQELRRVAMNAILRDIKHSARIPIENNYLLVGVADEGPAYERRGVSDVYCLNEGEIFVCIQKEPDFEPLWLQGNASISRSPVAHIGDVQRVRLVGEPPKDKSCFFRHLRNVVVMPSRGDRPLALGLGGGDLDGDMFSVICLETLLPTSHEDPASYESAGTKEIDQDSTVDDICDFVVEYINSDVLGLLSDRLLTIADQSNEGMRDMYCELLARLCSQAVDYPKQGIPVELDDNLPRPLIRCKPDWHSAEVVSPRKTDYYESTRALGYLFRAITLENTENISEMPHCTDPMSDKITFALFEKVKGYLGASAYVEEAPTDIIRTFKHYKDELSYICGTHTLSNAPGTNLLETEVVIGTILANCSQKRWRSDRIYRMREHATTLVREIKQSLLGMGISMEEASPMDIISGLERAWRAWNFSIYERGEFAAYSFGLIALSTIFNCLNELKERSV